MRYEVKVRHGSRGMQAYIGGSMLPLDTIPHIDALSITCLCWADCMRAVHGCRKSLGSASPMAPF